MMNRGINHIGLTFLVLKKPLLFKQGLDGKIAYDSQTKMMNQEVANMSSIS